MRLPAGNGSLTYFWTGQSLHTKNFLGLEPKLGWMGAKNSWFFLANRNISGDI